MMSLSWCARTKYDNLRDCRGVRERTGTCHENDSGRLCLAAVVYVCIQYGCSQIGEIP